MKPLHLPPVDDLLTKLNSAIHGISSDLRLRKLFADYDKRNRVYRVVFSGRLTVTFSAEKLSKMKIPAIKQSIIDQASRQIAADKAEQQAERYERTFVRGYDDD